MTSSRTTKDASVAFRTSVSRRWRGRSLPRTTWLSVNSVTCDEDSTPYWSNMPVSIPAARRPGESVRPPFQLVVDGAHRKTTSARARLQPAPDAPLQLLSHHLHP